MRLMQEPHEDGRMSACSSCPKALAGYLLLTHRAPSKTSCPEQYQGVDCEIVKILEAALPTSSIAAAACQRIQNAKNSCMSPRL